MGKWTDEALRMLPFVQKGVQMLDDTDAMQIKTVYPKWEDLVALGSVEAESGYKFVHDGKLFKCISANPTFQSDWIPNNGTESLYIRIDEEHAGTINEPIPYDGNMVLEYGKYYTQGGIRYLCTRDTINPVYNALSDLVGLYVEVA